MTDTLTKPRAARPLRKISAAQRKRIEAAVEAMINALDAMDEPDVDAEPDGEAEVDADEEPSLGAAEQHPSPYGASYAGQSNWAANGDDDREQEEGDLEPSFGWTINGTGVLSTDDCELDDCDREPSLGAIDAADQTRWASSGTGDIEEDHEDEPSLGWPQDRPSQHGGLGGTDDREA